MTSGLVGIATLKHHVAEALCGPGSCRVPLDWRGGWSGACCGWGHHWPTWCWSGADRHVAGRSGAADHMSKSSRRFRRHGGGLERRGTVRRVIRLTRWWRGCHGNARWVARLLMSVNRWRHHRLLGANSRKTARSRPVTQHQYHISPFFNQLNYIIIIMSRRSYSGLTTRNHNQHGTHSSNSRTNPQATKYQNFRN